MTTMFMMSVLKTIDMGMKAVFPNHFIRIERFEWGPVTSAEYAFLLPGVPKTERPDGTTVQSGWEILVVDKYGKVELTAIGATLRRALEKLALDIFQVACAMDKYVVSEEIRSKYRDNFEMIASFINTVKSSAKPMADC